MSPDQWKKACLCFLQEAASLVTFFSKNFTDASLPWLDSTLTTASLIAQWMVAKRKLKTGLSGLSRTVFTFRSLFQTSPTHLAPVFSLSHYGDFRLSSMEKVNACKSVMNKRIKRIALIGPESGKDNACRATRRALQNCLGTRIFEELRENLNRKYTKRRYPADHS
ncbi:MAG: nicotinamide mononucleotide transporter [Bacteroidetes bacterium]|nr:nicotinamide mononucleotide transporter [Bacteroidota bacterium]